jgi:hypothetical protein
VSDEKTEPAAATAAAAPPAERAVENPMGAWMRGGTMTSAYERQLAEQKAAAEKARAIEDSKRIAAERNPDQAKQHKHVLGGNMKYPGIVLEVREPRDNKVLDYIECELNVTDDGTLTLNMACFKCALTHGRNEQFQFNQKHKRFELDTRRQGELWVNPQNPRHIVTLAGTIHLTEIVTCPVCWVRIVIDNSVVREV